MSCLCAANQKTEREGEREEKNSLCMIKTTVTNECCLGESHVTVQTGYRPSVSRLRSLMARRVCFESGRERPSGDVKKAHTARSRLL